MNDITVLKLHFIVCCFPPPLYIRHLFFYDVSHVKLIPKHIGIACDHIIFCTVKGIRRAGVIVSSDSLYMEVFV